LITCDAALDAVDPTESTRCARARDVVGYDVIVSDPCTYGVPSTVVAI
jgi:hypothetical protein